MNTQTHVHHLEAGQALALSSPGGGPAVLREGELLLQQPARWLGGTVVLPAPVRLVAPALLPAGQGGSFVAVRPSSVVVQAAAPARASGRLLAAVAAWWRKLPGRRPAQA